MDHDLSSLPPRAVLPPPPTDLAAQFSIAVDAPRGLVRYTLAGFFDAATVAAICAERDDAARRLSCGPNRHLTLLDITGCMIQSRETMALFAEMLDDPRYRARATAVVVGGSLARTQLSRVLARPGLGYFTTVDEAEQWLFGPDGPGSIDADRVGH